MHKFSDSNSRHVIVHFSYQLILLILITIFDLIYLTYASTEDTHSTRRNCLMHTYNTWIDMTYKQLLGQGTVPGLKN